MSEKQSATSASISLRPRHQWQRFGMCTPTMWTNGARSPKLLRPRKEVCCGRFCFGNTMFVFFCRKKCDCCAFCFFFFFFGTSAMFVDALSVVWNDSWRPYSAYTNVLLSRDRCVYVFSLQNPIFLSLFFNVSQLRLFVCFVCVCVCVRVCVCVCVYAFAEALKEDELFDDKPAPLDKEDGEEGLFRVESILAHRQSKKKKKDEYLVKWVGWPSSANSWVSAADFSDPNTIKYILYHVFTCVYVSFVHFLFKKKQGGGGGGEKKKNGWWHTPPYLHIQSPNFPVRRGVFPSLSHTPLVVCTHTLNAGISGLRPVHSRVKKVRQLTVSRCLFAHAYANTPPAPGSPLWIVWSLV